MDIFHERVSSLLAEPIPYSFEELEKVQFSSSVKKMWIEEFNRTESLCSTGSDYSGFGGGWYLNMVKGLPELQGF